MSMSFGGDLTDGESVGYGTCVTGTIHVLTVTYDAPGNTPAGAMFKVLPHSDTPDAIQVVDCSQNLLEDGVGEETPVTQP